MQVRDGFQDSVARGMAERVVDPLKVVHVEPGSRQRNGAAEKRLPESF